MLPENAIQFVLIPPPSQTDADTSELLRDLDVWCHTELLTAFALPCDLLADDGRGHNREIYR